MDWTFVTKIDQVIYPFTHQLILYGIYYNLKRSLASKSAKSGYMQKIDFFFFFFFFFF